MARAAATTIAAAFVVRASSVDGTSAADENVERGQRLVGAIEQGYWPVSDLMRSSRAGISILAWRAAPFRCERPGIQWPKLNLAVA